MWKIIPLLWLFCKKIKPIVYLAYLNKYDFFIYTLKITLYDEMFTKFSNLNDVRLLLSELLYIENDRSTSTDVIGAYLK